MTTESIDVLLERFRGLASQLQSAQAPAATANKKQKAKKEPPKLAVWPATLGRRYLPQCFVDDVRAHGIAAAFERAGRVRMARFYEREVLSELQG